MEFKETLSVAVRNQKQKSSDMSYYKSRFDPPKKEQKDNDKLSANIQKFLAQKEGEERQKKLEARIKRKELIAMRDPKTLRRIEKTLKVIKSANKSVIEDAVDKNNTAITRDGPDQPDQDDYGFVSQEASAFYEKIMEKYSKLPKEPKCETKTNTSIEDLNSKRERVKNALHHEGVTVSYKRGRKEDNEKEPLQKYEPEKRHDKKTEKPIVIKQIPLHMDFHQLLKFAEENKSEPINTKNQVTEPDRLMTKKQKIEYEEEMARRKRRQERMEAEKASKRKTPKINKPKNELELMNWNEIEKELKPGDINCIPKLSDKYHDNKQYNLVKSTRKEKKGSAPDKERDREKSESHGLKYERKKEIIDMEGLEKDTAIKEIINIHTGRQNRDQYTSHKTNFKLDSKTDNLKKTVHLLQKPIQKLIQEGKNEKKKNVGVKSQNTSRLDKSQLGTNCSTTDNNGDSKQVKGLISPGKSVCKELSQKIYSGDEFAKTNKKMHTGHQSLIYKGTYRSDSTKRSQSSIEIPVIRPEDKKPKAKSFARLSKSKITNSFNFDKYVNSTETKGVYQLPPGVDRKPNPVKLNKKGRLLFFSESDCESESDDFIDEEKVDYSKHIKKIFGYDKSKYRDTDDDDDLIMESSYAQQQREEYVSKKIGIMEDLEEMQRDAMEKKKLKKRYSTAGNSGGSKEIKEFISPGKKEMSKKRRISDE